MDIGIIDYEMGNLGSVSNACEFLGLDAGIITRPDEMDACAAIILPGVGAFGNCMEHLSAHGFVDPVREWIAADRPFLGICLGLQALFEGSEEDAGIAGLGIFPGNVRKFDLDDLKVPQMGWNRVRQRQPDSPFFRDVPDESFFYFVHSYYVDTPDDALVAGETEYGIVYSSAIARGRMMALQFHPEKSQELGLKILENFGSIAGDAG